jgi:cytosine/adenosine deaminase-related metal-dependent hydrolase
MFITDLGSLGIPPVYHHLYNLGNLPLFLAFGAKYKAMELDKNGRIAERKYINYTVVSTSASATAATMPTL